MTLQNSRIEHSQRHLSLFTFLSTLIVLNFGIAHAQKNDQYGIWIENSVHVNGTVDQAWNVLADFAGVGTFHVLYDETVLLNGNSKKVVLGAERESLIPDGMFNLIQKERVVDLVEGSYFTYEIYDSEKSSLESLLVTFGVMTDEDGHVMIYNHVVLQEGSKVWKNLSKRKQNRDSQMSLISYKHRIETGGSEKDIKRLKKWFALNEEKRQVRDLLATTDLTVN